MPDALQAALQEAQGQNERLMLTVSAMRADMESMQRHPSSPGPQPQAHPLPTPPMSSQPMPDTLQHASVAQDTALPSNNLHGGNVTDLAYQQQQYHQQQQQQHGQQQQQHQQQQQLLIAAEGVKVSQQHEIEQLRQQLQDAQQVSEDIAAENERLMELSSALRSERDRAVLSQGNAVKAVVNGQIPPQQVPAHHHQSQQLTIAATPQQHSATAYSGNLQQPLQYPPITLPPAPRLPQQPTAYPQQECYVGYAYPVMQQHSMQQYVQPQQQHQQPDQRTPAAVVHGQGLEAAGQGSAVQQPLGQGQKTFQSEKQVSQGHSSEDGMSSEVGTACSGC